MLLCLINQHVLKIMRRGGTINTCVRKQGTAWRLVVSFTSWPPYYKRMRIPFLLFKTLDGAHGRPGQVGGEIIFCFAEK